MIYSATSTVLQREKCLEYIKEKGFKRVIDVGGVLGPWSKSVVTHYADLQKFEETYMMDDPSMGQENLKPVFKLDFCDPFTWEEIKEEVAKNGKFDFALSTQVLEHASSEPQMPLKHFFPMIANEGFIGVPNRFVELSYGIHWDQKFRGFLPHRWVFTVRENSLHIFPKLGFLEYLDLPWVKKKFRSEELSFFWKDTIECVQINDSVMDYPDPMPGIKFFTEELEKGDI